METKEEDGESQALGQQVSMWKRWMTDASVSVPTVVTLWEQRRCLLPPLASLPLIPPSLSTGCDVGITRQEQSSQQWSDHTGTVLHVDRGEGEVMERSRPVPNTWEGLGGGGGGGYKCGGQRMRTGEGLSRWAVGTSWDVGSVAVLPVRKADVFTRGCAKFAEQPSAAWRSGL